MIVYSDNIHGTVQPISRITEMLETRFPGKIISITSAFPVWPMEAWSNTFLLQLTGGGQWFLKGTPRCRREAELTVALSSLAAEYIPTVLIDDIAPEDEWHWFLLDDAGKSVETDNFDFPDIETACVAVRALATIQLRARNCEEIKRIVPDCTPTHLQQTALDTCVRWAEESADAGTYQDVIDVIAGDTRYFADLSVRLAVLPSTLVHGDLWAGNVVRHGDSIRLIDWADALWGPGGISIQNLLGAASLAARDDEIWDAYASGLGNALPPAYRQACREAATITSIVVHDQIHQCCATDACVDDGRLETMQQLAEQISVAQ